jgi:hypothetical protein
MEKGILKKCENHLVAWPCWQSGVQADYVGKGIHRKFITLAVCLESTRLIRIAKTISSRPTGIGILMVAPESSHVAKLSYVRSPRKARIATSSFWPLCRIIKAHS